MCIRDSYTPPAGFPTAGYKISDNLRLDSSDLTVEGALNITGTIGASGSKTATYGYSSYNHVGAAALGYGRTNLSVGNVVLLAADYVISFESDAGISQNSVDNWINATNSTSIRSNDVELGTHYYSNTGVGTNLVRIESNDSYYAHIGKHDGTTSLPSSGHFAYYVTCGGLDQTTGIQQAGRIWNSAGTAIDLYSPLINIGSLNYGGGYGNTSSSNWLSGNNITTNVNLTASTKIDLKCNQVDVQQDIDITRALGVNGNYGTAGQVLTSGGSGNAMSWTTPNLTTDTYTPAVYYPFPAGHPYASVTFNAPPVGIKADDNLRIVKDPNVTDSGSLLVQGRLDIEGAIGSTGSKTAMFNFSSFNHPAGTIFGLGRTNLNLANTVYMAADSAITGESDKDIHFKINPVSQKSSCNMQFSMGESNGSTPLPSSGRFHCHWRIGGYNSSTNVQQTGDLDIYTGGHILLNSPNIHIGAGSTGWGSGGSGGPNTTTSVNLHSIQSIELNSQTSVNVSGGPLNVNSNPVNATAFNVTSDDRLKHNEEDITDSLSIIRKLKPQKYQKTKEMKDADFNGTLTEGEYTVEAGFIAQDIMNDIPEINYVVEGGGTGTRTTKEYNHNPNPIPSPSSLAAGIDDTQTSNTSTQESETTQTITFEKPYSVNYTDILTYNVAATKELDTIVTNLLTKIATLEARITELENK